MTNKKKSMEGLTLIPFFKNIMSGLEHLDDHGGVGEVTTIVLREERGQVWGAILLKYLRNWVAS